MTARAESQDFFGEDKGCCPQSPNVRVNRGTGSPALLLTASFCHADASEPSLRGAGGHSGCGVTVRYQATGPAPGVYSARHSGWLRAGGEAARTDLGETVRAAVSFARNNSAPFSPKGQPRRGRGFGPALFLLCERLGNPLPTRRGRGCGCAPIFLLYHTAPGDRVRAALFPPKESLREGRRRSEGADGPFSTLRNVGAFGCGRSGSAVRTAVV